MGKVTNVTLPISLPRVQNPAICKVTTCGAVFVFNPSCAFGLLAHSRNSKPCLFTEDERKLIARNSVAHCELSANGG